MESNFSIHSMTRTVCVLVVLAFWFVGTFRLSAEPYGPGWLAPTENRPVNQNQASAAQTQASTSAIVWSTPVDADYATTEVKELARGLQYDPLRIFSYVRSQIRYEHYYGCKKGAALTLLEKSGNDFDQSALLVSLLREAATANPGAVGTVTYKYGTMTVPLSSPDQRDLIRWLGLSSLELIRGVTDRGGWPFASGADATIGGTNDTQMTIARVCVEAVIAGTPRLFDPSFKKHIEIVGLATTPTDTLNTASGYNQAAFLSTAGGSVGTVDATRTRVSSINVANVENYLKARATALTSYLKTQPASRNASIAEVIGGRQIDVSESTDYSSTAYFQWNQVLETWSEIPGEKASVIRIQGGAGLDWSLPMAELRGRRLSIVPSGGDPKRIQIWLDDTMQAEETGSAAGIAIYLVTTIFHPFRDISRDQWDYTDTSPGTLYSRYGRYVIAYAFDPGADHVRQREEKVAAYKAAGFADDSREVDTETLNLMALQWLRQSELASHLVERAVDTIHLNYHRVGRAGHDTSFFYVDIRIQMLDYQERQRANGALGRKFFEVSQYLASAFEHGIVEQLTGGEAVSTTRLFKWAFTGRGLGGAVPVVRELNAAGNTFLYPSTSNYSGKAYFTVNNWVNGSGFARVNSTEVAMIISPGGYQGGVQTNSTIAFTPTQALNNYYSDSDFVYINPTSHQPTLSQEPIDLATGAYDYDHVDLTLGDAEPRGLVFSRHYNSRLRLRNDAKMGFGWTHDYYIRSIKCSDAETAFGGGTPAQAAAALVAIHAALDFYDITDVKKWTCVMLACGWAVDQATTNSVSIQLGERTLRFLKQVQANGTNVYLPPAGLPLTLVDASGGYTMTFRHGNSITFDSSGHGTKITDPYGKQLTISYNGDLTRTITDCFGRSLTIGYDPGNAKANSVTDNTSSRSVAFTIDARYDLASYTDPEGKVWNYDYKADYSQGDHRLEKTRDPDNRVIVQNVYDAKDRVKEQLSQGDSARRWKFYYGESQTVEENPLGGRRTFSFDDKHRLIAQTSAEGRTVRYGYDGQDHVTSVTTPLGETTSIQYDGNNNPTLITDPLLKTTRLFYDSLQRLDYVIDPRGKTTDYTFNSFHQPQRIVSAEGVTTDFVYYTSGTPMGLLNKKTVAGTITTTLEYDSWGGLNKITYPNGSDIETFTNNNRGDVLTHVDLRGFTTTFTYNNRRQLLRTTLPGGGTANYLENIYDNSGNLATQYDRFRNRTDQTYSSTQKPLVTTFRLGAPNFETFTRQYDARDWLEKTIDYRGAQERIEYFADGKVRRVFDRLNRQRADLTYDTNGRNRDLSVPRPNASGTWSTTTASYTARGELLNAQDPIGLTEFTNDDNGNLQSRKNRRNGTWQFTYNLDNQLWDTISPLTRAWQKRYNNRGLLQTVTEPSGQSTTLTPDLRDRVASLSDAIGNIAFAYEKDGLVNTVQESAAGSPLLDRDYDALGRLIKYTHGVDYTLQWIYQDPQNAFILRYPGNKDVRYDFDNRGRLWKVTDWASRVTTYQYDNVGRLELTTRPNGTKRKVTYDDADQITRIEELNIDGRVISLFSYASYWGDGQPRQQFSVPNRTVPIYPATITFDNDDRVATWNGQNVVHDADGNLTNGPLPPRSWSNQPSPGLGSYSFDARNRLTACGGVSYSYDAENLRTKVTTATGTTIWVINPAAGPAQPLVRTKPDGSVTRYVLGIGLLYEEDGATGQTKTYHYDRRGSTVALSQSDGRTVALMDRWSYGPYGEESSRLQCLECSGSDTPFRFNGFFGVQTDSNGLLYMNARYYNVELRRFISADPMGFAEGPNFYAFANGDPISLADPFGLGVADGTGNGWIRLLGGKFKMAVGLMIGEDYGAAWRSLARDIVTRDFVEGPTGGVNGQIPRSLADGMRKVFRSVPPDAALNGFHAWHAGSNGGAERGLI